jgi:3-deoxy-D-manno-octulosonate 8-phosphate phosphatase (KDO 8-P phosphatase)
VNNAYEIFQEKGGEFVSSPFLLKEKLHHVKAILFDWDGVFHSGYKNETRTSSFSEADSMGVNMLRFGLYLQQSKELPFTGIITGENNPTAVFWAEREHLNTVIQGAKDKRKVVEYLQREKGILPEEIMFVFDDVLDLSLAQRVGTRFLIQKPANPLFLEFCRKNRLADYITFSSGAEHGVREVSEVVLLLLNRFDETIEKRMAFEGEYSDYFAKRQSVKTKILAALDL